jgi:hypothetical protein
MVKSYKSIYCLSTPNFKDFQAQTSHFCTDCQLLVFSSFNKISFFTFYQKFVSFICYFLLLLNKMVCNLLTITGMYAKNNEFVSVNILHLSRSEKMLLSRTTPLNRQDNEKSALNTE